ncbi:MAG: hypothetical protein ACR2IE_05560 [Candidatus Sumerlaeaceae bacterium]
MTDGRGTSAPNPRGILRPCDWRKKPRIRQAPLHRAPLGPGEFLREDYRFSSGEITPLEKLEYMSNPFKLLHLKLEKKLEKLENLKASTTTARALAPSHHSSIFVCIRG